MNVLTEEMDMNDLLNQLFRSEIRTRILRIVLSLRDDLYTKENAGEDLLNMLRELDI